MPKKRKPKRPQRKAKKAPRRRVVRKKARARKPTPAPTPAPEPAPTITPAQAEGPTPQVTQAATPAPSLIEEPGKPRQEVGRVTHSYPKILVAVVELKLPLAVGDKIYIVGRTTHVEQVVESMQIEHKEITTAKPGQSIGLKVIDRVREADVVYR